MMNRGKAIEILESGSWSGYDDEEIAEAVKMGAEALKEKIHGECRDRLKEVFREQSSISGDMFHLSQIERIIDGEDWL